MRTLKIALMATVATAAFSTATFAADLMLPAEEPVVEAAASATSFDGPYVGLFVLGQTDPGTFGVGVNAGVNFDTDGLMVGVEGDVSYLFEDSEWQGQVVGKLGAALADSAAIYGLVGFGYHSEDETYVPVGVGVEFAVAENMSLKAQYEYHWDLEGAGSDRHVGKVGVNFHF